MRQFVKKTAFDIPECARRKYDRWISPQKHSDLASRESARGAWISPIPGYPPKVSGSRAHDDEGQAAPMARRRPWDALVVGGGVVGCAVLRELTVRLGCRVSG